MSSLESQSRIPFAVHRATNKIAFIAAVVGFALVFLGLAGSRFLASYYASKADLPSIERALRLSPDNAEYHLMLARYLSVTESNPRAAAEEYRRATLLNPHEANAWFELAGTAQVLDDAVTQRLALENAVAMDPTTPEFAWQAGSFFLVQGESEKALQQFRVVVANEPSLRFQTFDLAMRTADVDTVMAKVVPAESDAYLDLLNLLVSRKNSDGAQRVWSGITRLGKPIEPKKAFGYINYLISQQDVPQARTAWRQMLRLAGLSGYDVSPDNLIVNANFDADILNNGFDWHHSKLSNVALALDPTEFHSGRQSLSIVFDGPGVNGAGIFQFIPVEPDTPYEFSAYYKTRDMDGAGGPRFSISDAYTGANLYTSDDLKNAEIWRDASGSFVTGPKTELLVLRVVRVPEGSPIRGHLWVDDFHLFEKHP